MMNLVIVMTVIEERGMLSQQLMENTDKNSGSNNFVSSLGRTLFLTCGFSTAFVASWVLADYFFINYKAYYGYVCIAIFLANAILILTAFIFTNRRFPKFNTIYISIISFLLALFISAITILLIGPAIHFHFGGKL